jgi:hypothetical protein
MLSSNTSPSAWRVAIAFVTAPTAAALALAWVVPLYGVMPDHAQPVIGSAVLYAFGAYATTLVFGLPTFLALRRRLRPTLIRCILVGVAVAAAPWLLLALFTPRGDAAITDFVARIAAVGAVGGAVFWLLALACPPPRAR